MIPSLLRKEFRERRVSLVLYSVACILLVWLYVALWPSLQAQAQTLSKVFESMPKGILKGFGIEGTGLESVDSLLAGKQFGFVWPILLIIIALSSSARAIAGEIENNTIGTLLSQPLSRTKIYWNKYVSALAGLLVFTVVTSLSTIVITKLYSIDSSAWAYVQLAALASLFGASILSLGFLVSASSNERSRVYSAVGGILLLMYVLNIISGIQDRFHSLQYISVFHYFDVNQPLNHHNLSLASCALFAIVAIISAVAGYVVFTKRDISI